MPLTGSGCTGKVRFWWTPISVHHTRALSGSLLRKGRVPCTWRHTQAALTLIDAMNEADDATAWALCEQAMRPLEQLEVELARAEYPPFERWYAKTFIRNEETGLNLHRPYEVLRLFLASDGTQRLTRPETFKRPNLQQYLPLLEGQQ